MRAKEFVVEAPIPMDPSRRGFLKKAAGTAAAGATMAAAGPQITALVTNFSKQIGGLGGLQALQAMLKVATAREIYDMLDYYTNTGIMSDAITGEEMQALDDSGWARRPDVQAWFRANLDPDEANEWGSWNDFEEWCYDHDLGIDEAFKQVTGKPLKLELVDNILANTKGLEFHELPEYFEAYPAAFDIIDPYKDLRDAPTLEKLENIDVAAKGANLPAPVVTAANAISGLVRQIFKSKGKPLTPPQQVKPAQALSAPTKPEVELPVNVKQKQKVGQGVAESTTVKRDGITLKYHYAPNRDLIIVAASEDGSKELGQARFKDYGPIGQPKYKGEQVHVDDRYRGQGVATVMYDLARDLLKRVYPSDAQTQDGEAFWRGKPVWEQELNEFDPGEGGFGPFKVYYEQDYLIGQFPTYDEAMGEVDFLRDSDPKSATHHWRIVDGTGETVWEYDIGDEIDYHRHSRKFQRRP